MLIRRFKKNRNNSNNSSFYKNSCKFVLIRRFNKFIRRFNKFIRRSNKFIRRTKINSSFQIKIRRVAT